MSRNWRPDARPLEDEKPREAHYRLFDGDGLALLISAAGVKSWQLRHRQDGKDQTATLGKLSVLSLAEARRRADELRRLVADGVNLTTLKRTEKLKQRADRGNTFEIIAAAWMAREARRKKWSSRHATQVSASIRNHLLPLHLLPISKLDAQTIAPVLRDIERRAPLKFPSGILCFT